MGTSFESFNIQPPVMPINAEHLSWINGNAGVIDYESQASKAYQHEQCVIMRARLNEKQAEIFDRVEQALRTGERCCLYIPGSGGTGKTYLYRALCYLVRVRGLSILATAWTGNATALLEGGQTCHSRFGLLVPFNYESCSRFSANSYQAREIARARAILGDEASIMPGCFLVELDRLLRDLPHSEVVFGDKIFLSSGDFRQTLPVCRGASRFEIIQKCLNQQEIFRNEFEENALTENMRLEPDQGQYLRWLNALGNGQLPRFEGLHPDLILIPEQFVLQDRIVRDERGVEKNIPATEQNQINFVFESPFNVEASYTES